MRLITVAFVFLASSLTTYSAAPDESKSSGATLNEGLAQLIAAGPNTDDHKLWAKRAAHAADGNNWLEYSSQTLINTFNENFIQPQKQANWGAAESMTLLSAMQRQCDALDMSGRSVGSATVLRNYLAKSVKLDAKTPMLTRLAWLREEIFWNRRSIDPRSDSASTLFMQAMTQAVKTRAQLTSRQWGQLAYFTPMPDNRATAFRAYAPSKEYPPLLEALLKAEDFRPASMRHTLLAIAYFNKAWIERGGEYETNTSDEQRLAFRRNIALAYQEVLATRKAAAADNCNLTPLFRVISYSGAGPRAGAAASAREHMNSTEFLEECLRLARSDRERTEIVQTYIDYYEEERQLLFKKLRELVSLYGPESGVAIESLRYRAQINNVVAKASETKEDWNTRSLFATNKEIPKAIQLATEIQLIANKRHERLAYNGQFIDPKAIMLATLARFNQPLNPDVSRNLALTLAMPDSRYGIPSERVVDLNARHFLTNPPYEYPQRDRTGFLLLTERPALENEWWGWPTSTANKLNYEPSLIESWSKPGKISQVLATIKEVENSKPPLSALSHERLMTLKRVAEVTHEFLNKGVLNLPWSDPTWRDKASFFYISSENSFQNLKLGDRRFTMTHTSFYSDLQIMELRAPIPQPYAVEFEFKHESEVLPQRFPYPKYISSIGIWLQDPDDEVQAMFTGIRTSGQAGGVYFTPDPKERWAKANLFQFPASHPKANGKSKGGKARVELRNGHIVWFLDGIELYDSKKAGMPPMPMGLLRLGILSVGNAPGTATLGPVTISKLK